MLSSLLKNEEFIWIFGYVEPNAVISYWEM